MFCWFHLSLTPLTTSYQLVRVKLADAPQAVRTSCERRVALNIFLQSTTEIRARVNDKAFIGKVGVSKDRSKEDRLRATVETPIVDRVALPNMCYLARLKNPPD